MRGTSVDEAFGGPDPAPGGHSLRMLLQTRYRSTVPTLDPEVERLVEEQYGTGEFARRMLDSMVDETRREDGLRLNRAFLRFVSQPTAEFSGKVIVDLADLAEGGLRRSVKQAYGEVTPSKRVALRAGLFKVPFSLLELLPAANYELADIGPTDELVRDLGYAGRDVGVMLEVSPLKRRRWLRLEAGVFQGDAVGAQLTRGPGMLAGRISSRPVKQVRLGVNTAVRPRDVREVSSPDHVEFERGAAYGADVAFAHKRFELRTEWLTGDRTDYNRRVPAATMRPVTSSQFQALWTVAAYKVRLTREISWTPAVRLEWLDEDRALPVGEMTWISTGMTWSYAQRLRLLFDLTFVDVQGGTPRRDQAPVTYMTDSTVGVVQLQYRL